MDTKLDKLTSFHPLIDVKKEVVNKMIVHILRMYNSKNPLTWDESLPYVQNIYKISLHSSIGHDLHPFFGVLWVPSIGPH
jgi:hypothetical protein